jgi:carbon-monoxide dehydrogenase medium subunit
LNEARAANNHFEIGATTTLTRVAQMDVPLLSQAAKSVGSWSVRNMATLAGNLFAPPPAGDAATALLALDAEALCVRKNRERRIPLDQFFTGLMQTILAPNELVTKIIVPKPRGKTAYLKFGRRHANTPAVVTVAVQVMQDGKGVCTDARVALGAAADFPMRAKKAEAALKGRALDAKSIADASALAMEEAKPFTDALATEWYRRKMVGVFVRRALEGLK